jgi:hypothetical protein
MIPTDLKNALKIWLNKSLNDRFIKDYKKLFPVYKNVNELKYFGDVYIN